jgi:hypothetical protein
MAAVHAAGPDPIMTMFSGVDADMTTKGRSESRRISADAVILESRIYEMASTPNAP